MEVQRSDLIGQYLGSTTQKTKEKILEARGGVLFIDKAYGLIPSAGGKDFGREAMVELMAVMEAGNPDMVFTEYADKMEKFLNVNPGHRFIESLSSLIILQKNLTRFSTERQNKMASKWMLICQNFCLSIQHQPKEKA